MPEKKEFSRRKRVYAQVLNAMSWHPVIGPRVCLRARIRQVASVFDDGCCAQSEADLADDFITTPSFGDASAAVDGRSVAPVSKPTKLPKPAPATGSSLSKKPRMSESPTYVMPTKKSAELAMPSGTRRSSPVADVADDFKSAPTHASRSAKRAAQPTAIPRSSVESAAVDARSVAPVSKLTKPAPATDAATLKAEMKRWYGRISAGAHT